MILTFGILLSLCGGASVTQQSEATSSANDLVEAAVQNELNRSDTIDIRYTVESQQPHSRLAYAVVGGKRVSWGYR